MLPGEPTTANGTPAYVYGFNNGPEWAEPAFSQLSSVQAQVKAGGLTIDRIWAADNAGTGGASGDIGQGVLSNKIAAAKAAGATCYLNMDSTGDLSWMESVVNYAEPQGCHYFEFGNEVDGASGYSIATYTSQWDAAIPTLRALPVCKATNACLFGGPTVAYPTADAAGGYPSGVAYWLANLNKSTASPDFVSWHDYPCNGADSWASTTAASQADCINWTDTTATQCAALGVCNVSLGYAQSQMFAWEQQYLGKTLPTGISEWNFDPGFSALTAWGDDGTFMAFYTAATLNFFARNTFSFAMQYTALDYAGYGYLDMFSDSAPYSAKPQFTAMAAAVRAAQTGASVKDVARQLTSGPYTGAIALDAGASGSPVRVTYALDGKTYTAVPTYFGWFDLTAPPPAGTYTVTVTATYAGGATVTSSVSLKVTG
jgi:hypothetical protein